jgi:hypothetical protein
MRDSKKPDGWDNQTAAGIWQVQICLNQPLQLLHFTRVVKPNTGMFTKQKT